MNTYKVGDRYQLCRESFQPYAAVVIALVLDGTGDAILQYRDWYTNQRVVRCRPNGTCTSNSRWTAMPEPVLKYYFVALVRSGGTEWARVDNFSTKEMADTCYNNALAAGTIVLQPVTAYTVNQKEN